MRDNEDWINPAQGEPNDEDMPGSLLFDPNAVPDVEFEGPAAPSGGGLNRIAILLGFVLGVTAVFAMIVVVNRSPDAAGAALELPTEGPAPVASERMRIVPIPDTLSRAPVSTAADVAFRVMTSSGVALADAELSFQIESGDGALIEGTARTDSLGVARTTVALPERPGVTVVLATLADSTISPGRMTVAADAGAPARIRMVTGDGQTGPAGELLQNRVVVIITDETNNPVPNTEVQFRAAPGAGLTAPSRTRTDETGRASALWRLGPGAGVQRLSAISSDLLADVTFSATAVGAAAEAAPSEQRPETAPVSVGANPLTVGGSHVCAIRNGTVSCRGGNDRGQLAGNGAARFVALTAGGSHTCGVDGSGVASCWGGNDHGQLGDGSREDKPRPTRVRTELRFSALSAGASHTCGLAGGGVPFCWGQNLSGQLGDGSRNDQTSPRTVGGGMQFRSLVSGWSHTCGLTSSGNAFCWGLNSQGQLGDGSRLDRLVPNLVRGAVDQLVAGSAHTCGISEGKVLCWGANSAGQLGDGTQEDRTQPTEVVGLPRAPTHVTAGAVHTCALLEGGAAYCWGQNLHGQLGEGGTANHARPVAVAGGLTFADIQAGGAQTCAVTAAGAEYCWGQNLQGQLGDGTRVNRPAPTRVVN
jgi:hypothetical protein